MSTEKPELKDPTIEVVVNDDQSITAQHVRTSSDKLIGSVLDNKIEIEEIIGQGGMSIVYKARHMVLDRPVAVKVILPGMGFTEKAVLRLQQEAKAAFSLSHKNLASVHDVSLTSEGWPYLVMDFAAGETLAAMLERGPIEPKRAIDIFSQICEGLSAAHGQGVIHRDIKPGNIMVEHLPDGSDHVRIVDFGIAKKVTENADEIQKLTQTGEVFGTPLYMSPEQCRGERLGKQSDVYSLGCVFYEALTGSTPFKGDSAIATIMNHLGKPFPMPAKSLNISEPLIAVLKRCLEKDGANRYQTVAELGADLLAIKYGGTPKHAARAGIQRRSRLTYLIVGALSIIVLVSAVTAYLVIDYHWTQTYYGTIAGCNKRIAENPHDIKALYTRGRLNMDEHQFTRAAADFTECIKLSKNPAIYYANRADPYIQLLRWQDALDDCNSALKLDPNLTRAYGTRAYANYALLHYEQSLADSEKYLAANPNDPNLLRNKARCLIVLSRQKEAIEILTKAIALDPDNSQPYADRAWAYDYQHDTDQAIADATKAIGLNREGMAYFARGYAYYLRHEYDKALVDLHAGMEIDPKNVNGLTLQGKTLAATGKLDEAMAILTEVISQHPTYPPGWKARAQVYKKEGREELANKDLQRWKSLPKYAVDFDD